MLNETPDDLHSTTQQSTNFANVGSMLTQRWLLVASDFCQRLPTTTQVRCLCILSTLGQHWANGRYLFKMAVSNKQSVTHIELVQTLVSDRLSQATERSNQGQNMMLHTYTPKPMSLPSINFVHLTVSEI